MENKHFFFLIWNVGENNGEITCKSLQIFSHFWKRCLLPLLLLLTFCLLLMPLLCFLLQPFLYMWVLTSVV